jgi:uncharacterized protein YoxC
MLLFLWKVGWLADDVDFQSAIVNPAVNSVKGIVLSKLELHEVANGILIFVNAVQPTKALLPID